MHPILAQAVEFAPVGSRRTCNPPPMDTDDDYLLIVADHYAFRNSVLAAGFRVGGSAFLDAAQPLDADMRFSSYVLGDLNLIVTEDRVFYDRFMAATSVAKRLNLLKKDDRIALFQAVLYGTYHTRSNTKWQSTSPRP